MTATEFGPTTDPKWVKPARYSLIERTFLPIMRDERDLVFIRITMLMSITVVPFGLSMFLLPSWIIGLAALPYIAFIFLTFGGRFGLMLHAVGHRPVFKREYKFLQNYIPWVLGPFLGHTPTSFEAFHMWMHHAENNMLGDHSSTLPYTRDRFTHFLHYFVRFFIMGYVHVSRYLLMRGRRKIAIKFAYGEISWFVLVGAALVVNWAAALVVFIVPMVMMRWLMMAGNFAQHSFIDVDNPDDGFGNSTCLTNTFYNHKSYNDGYHIVHHNKPGMHWTEMSMAYENSIQDYIDRDAVVFSGIADNQAIWFLLMTRNYDKLANHLVNFRDRTHEQKVAFLQDRTRKTIGQVPGVFTLETVERMKAVDCRADVPLEEALVAE